MFILHGNNGRRTVYDLKNKIKLIQENGKISCYQFAYTEVFKDIHKNGLSFYHSDNLDEV